MFLLTEEVGILECSVDHRKSLEGSFLKMSTRHPGVSTVPSKDIPPWEAKLLPTSTEDKRDQKSHSSLVPQEKKLVYSSETLQTKKVVLTEKKLESSEKVWNSTTTTTTAVVVPSSGDQRGVGSTQDTEGRSLRKDPHSGLSGSGFLHNTLHTFITSAYCPLRALETLQ